MEGRDYGTATDEAHKVAELGRDVLTCPAPNRVGPGCEGGWLYRIACMPLARLS